MHEAYCWRNAEKNITVMHVCTPQLMTCFCKFHNLLLCKLLSKSVGHMSLHTSFLFQLNICLMSFILKSSLYCCGYALLWWQYFCTSFFPFILMPFLLYIWNPHFKLFFFFTFVCVITALFSVLSWLIYFGTEEECTFHTLMRQYSLHVSEQLKIPVVFILTQCRKCSFK